MLTLDRVLDELWQQAEVTNVITLRDIEIIDLFGEITTPFVRPIETTVSVPMPWLRARLW